MNPPKRDSTTPAGGDMTGARYVHVVREPTATVIEIALPEWVDGVDFDAALEAVLNALVDGGTSAWVLDFTGSSYMGSSILGLMVNVRQRVRASGGKLVLCGLSSRLLQVIHTCSMERLFVIARSRKEALAAK